MDLTKNRQWTGWDFKHKTLRYYNIFLTQGRVLKTKQQQAQDRKKHILLYSTFVHFVFFYVTDRMMLA